MICSCALEYYPHLLSMIYSSTIDVEVEGTDVSMINNDLSCKVSGATWFIKT